MDKMKIEIWSDIACPFCYIGKRKFEKALSRFQYIDNIEIVWRSYVLDPDLPKGKNEKTYFQYLAEMKNSTEEEARESFNEIKQLALAEGLDFSPDKIQVTNTIDALRLVKLANKYNLANEAEEALFKAYFIDGENISDKDTLVTIGVNIGISAADVVRSYETFEYTEDVTNDAAEGEEKYQLEYIPFYLLNNKFIIQGSVSADEYVRVLTEAYEDWSKHGESKKDEIEESVKGKSCSIDGTCSI